MAFQFQYLAQLKTRQAKLHGQNIDRLKLSGTLKMSRFKLVAKFNQESVMFSIIDIVQTYIVGLMIVIPFAIIYKRAGFHPAWAALVFLPVFGLLLIFLHLALFPWPNQKGKLEV